MKNKKCYYLKKTILKVPVCLRNCRSPYKYEQQINPNERLLFYLDCRMKAFEGVISSIGTLFLGLANGAPWAAQRGGATAPSLPYPPAPWGPKDGGVAA